MLREGDSVGVAQAALALPDVSAPYTAPNANAPIDWSLDVTPLEPPNETVATAKVGSVWICDGKMRATSRTREVARTTVNSDTRLGAAVASTNRIGTENEALLASGTMSETPTANAGVLHCTSAMESWNGVPFGNDAPIGHVD